MASDKKRYAKLICILAARMQEGNTAYIDALSRYLTKEETLAVQNYINEHLLYADPEIWPGNARKQ